MNKEHYTEADFITYEVLIILEAKIEKARELIKCWRKPRDNK